MANVCEVLVGGDQSPIPGEAARFDNGVGGLGGGGIRYGTFGLGNRLTESRDVRSPYSQMGFEYSEHFMRAVPPLAPTVPAYHLAYGESAADDERSRLFAAGELTLYAMIMGASRLRIAPRATASSPYDNGGGTLGSQMSRASVAADSATIQNSVFTTSGRRIGNFLEDSSILQDVASQRVVYVTSVAEKAALKKALRTNPFIQSSGRMPQVRYLHGYDGDVVSAASRQLVGAKRVSSDVTILSRRRIQGYGVEVHVGYGRGAHIHIGRGSSTPVEVRLSDPDWFTHVPEKVLNDPTFRDSILKAVFYGL
jgi:hypothetical protein